MPWKTSRPVDLKLEFVRRLKAGERMTDLCVEYGIHRQTGYEVQARYEAGGVEALLPRSRAPRHIPHRTPSELVELIIAGRKAHPTWGPKILKGILEKQHDVRLPAPSTIGDILKRAGLVDGTKRQRSRARPLPTGLREAKAPNDLWCADYKGQFRLGDSSYCYPLTMTDQLSRKILCCDAMPAIDEDQACESSLQTFRRYGLPWAMRTDNGGPFASTALARLTRLSVLWLRLGIELERITPGEPQENGRHERMHRTLKLETARPPGANILQQQERFDRFVAEFNGVRPHQALGLKPPDAIYEPSTRPLPEKLPSPEYPLHDDVGIVTQSGVLAFARRERYYLCPALAGQEVGLRELDDGRWLVTFVQLDLGYINRKTRKFETIAATPPAAQETSPMLPV